MKNTILYDFMQIFKSINCDSLYCNCNDCSNKKLCDTVEDVVKNIGGLYSEKNRTLLEDVKIIYYTISCDYIPNYFCSSCSCCKNKSICKMIENLISSLKKYY